ncbi:hypothetical protein BDZ94DRAFT_1166100 [Collybia nuda]|uniref:Uncharacterized protein n=1 Tax=Collybia nuda TaxID=64659 RepID=A0A9P5Y6N2_9AGAR|nr:hypothetical protein BDZ94DRAFT_1166100 [Collybia nuda]
MPSLITTIEDNSPLITYSSEWKTGSSADGSASLYSGSSFTYTNTSGASATFIFNGTSVEIFGSKRGNHGLYQVKIDDTYYPPISGNATEPGEFQKSLFFANDLSLGLHHLTLTNQENAFVDLDFITWKTSIGSDNEQLYVDTFEDSDPSFVYLPSDSSWTNTPNNLGTYLGGSGHATTTPGAVFFYTFNGDGVSLVGPIGPNGAAYTVQVDGGQQKNYSSINQYYTPHSTLYHADSLGPGQHRLKLSYASTSPDQVFSIDYATVYSASSPRKSCVLPRFYDPRPNVNIM